MNRIEDLYAAVIEGAVNSVKDHDPMPDYLRTTPHYVVGGVSSGSPCDEADCYSDDRRRNYVSDSQSLDLCDLEKAFAPC